MAQGVFVVGSGRTGARVASLLAGVGDIDVVVADVLPSRADAVAARLGDRVTSRGDRLTGSGLDAAVLCVPRPAHRRWPSSCWRRAHR